MDSSATNNVINSSTVNNKRIFPPIGDDYGIPKTTFSNFSNVKRRVYFDSKLECVQL